MSEEKQKRKPVYFSLQDEFDLKLLAHAEKINPVTNKPQNFSKYVRRLIEEDMNKRSTGGVNMLPGTDNEPIVRKEKDAYTLEAMGGFL